MGHSGARRAEGNQDRTDVSALWGVRAGQLSPCWGVPDVCSGVFHADLLERHELSWGHTAVAAQDTCVLETPVI